MGFVGLFLTVTLANLFTELLTGEAVSAGKLIGISLVILFVLALL